MTYFYFTVGKSVHVWWADELICPYTQNFFLEYETAKYMYKLLRYISNESRTFFWKMMYSLCAHNFTYL